MATSRTREIPTGFRDAHQEVVPSYFTSTRDVLIAFAFHCNLACTFCMVEDSLDVKKGVGLDVFREFARNPEATRDVRRIVFSGGEVTLDDALLEYVAVARSIPSVRHIRLQTNATKLASPKFVAALRAAGVDEFFISLHGGTAATVDQITQVEGSFKAILNGIAAVAGSGASLFTNTCITEPNFRELPGLVELIRAYRPAGMDFWGLWPRLDLTDRRALHARVGDVRPFLVEALRRCEQAGIHPVVKWFPRCLLGGYGKYQNDSQPTVLIQNDYWDAAPEFACIYEGICAYGNDNPCAGLSEAYIRRHGWEERLLMPTVASDRSVTMGETPKPPARPGAVAPGAPRATAFTTDAARAAVTPGAGSQAQHAPRGDEPRAGGGPAARGTADRGKTSPAVDAWIERLGLHVGHQYGAYVLRGGTLAGGAVRLQMDDGQHGYTAFVRERASGQPSFGETSSLALAYSRVERDREASVVASIERLLATLRAGDRGDLRLPSS